MDNPFLLALLMVCGLLVIFLLLYLSLGGFNVKRISLGIRTELRILRDKAFAAKVAALSEPAESKPAPPSKPSGAPLRLLALLQREGRLLDFLLEDVQGYSDDQVGAAVRDIHRNCQKVLREHLVLKPILELEEGQATEVPPGFDPSAIRLTGNVTGQPPFRGVLQHHGWRVQELKLAPPPEGQDEFVVMPAEVELS